MAELRLENASISFPIYDSRGKSFTNQLVKVATGGRLGKDSHGTVTVDALNDISLHLKDGDRLGLMGHNGSGKTTLLRLLAGIYEPSSGKAFRQGKIGSLVDIGLGINPDATGIENIELRSAIMGVPKKQLKSLQDEIIEFSELGDFIRLPVRTYSTGMQMRLAFAVATAIQPEILLMDEWLSVGDEAFKNRAEQKLKELVKGSSILVLASHSRKLLESSTQKAVILDEGQFVRYGPTYLMATEYF